MLSDVHFELGLLYENLGRPGDAIESFTKGNAILARDTQAAAMLHARSEEYLGRLKRAFAGPTALPATPPAPSSTGERAPVFLVGFPRSGTSLLDQVLDAHPGVQVLEERATLTVVRDELLVRGNDFPANLFDISDTDLAAFRKLYFQAVDRAITRDPGAVLIDSLPLNILDAGLIHRLFPDAKFILALRHPCDVCLSCFMQPLALNDATVHFTQLDDTVGFYEQVMALWQTQHDALALNVHEVRHEDLVNGQEQAVRKLLEFLGVSWDDRVLTTAPVADAIGRWRTYEIHMTPYLARLRPFIKAFGYANGAA